VGFGYYAVLFNGIGTIGFSEWAETGFTLVHWRLRGSENRNRVHAVGEIAASEVKAIKDFLGSQHMQDVLKRVNAMSTAPLEFIWLEELAP
jgi:hypothetical protein